MVAISEQIVVELKRRLEQISIANGYSIDLADVVRPKRIDEGAYEDHTLFINEPSITPNSEMSCPGNPPATAWNMAIELNGLLRQSENDTNPRNTARHNFVSEIILAITNEATTPDAWHTWEGLAINTTWGEITDSVDGDGTDSGFVFSINIVFRTDENDPFVAR